MTDSIFNMKEKPQMKTPRGANN